MLNDTSIVLDSSGCLSMPLIQESHSFASLKISVHPSLAFETYFMINIFANIVTGFPIPNGSKIDAIAFRIPL